MTDDMTTGEADAWRAGWRAAQKVAEPASVEADRLLRIALHAVFRLGLEGKGSDLGLCHEHRMYALNFSPEKREGPGALQVNGNGAAYECLNALAALRAMQPPEPGRKA
jgi:hypothetical protein